jgi:prepilin-type N-terminal cleavage/methylation domain-containing protein
MSPRHAPAAHTLDRSTRSSSRDGFTLAELVVALGLLTVGLLALASTSAFLTYAHAASGRAEQAAVVGGSRLEMLRAGACAPERGTEIIDGLSLAWDVTPSPGGAATATVRISWNERGVPSAQHYASAFQC